MAQAKPFLQTNECIEVYRGLEFVGDELKQALSDPYHWKWVIIGLDNCLQNTMVAALRDSAGYNILKNREKWWAAYTLYREGKTRALPDERLDDFRAILEGVQSESVCRYHGSRKLEPNAEQMKAILDLRGFRNSFAHFVPRGWSISVFGLPEMVCDVTEVIRFLLFESMVFPWVCEKDISRSKKAVNRVLRLAVSHKNANDILLAQKPCNGKRGKTPKPKRVT
jgi:hypothetical protein